MIPKVFYQIFVRSFADSNGDGIGDLNGITAKLDYLADLGVEGIWLTPIFYSPSYHKYDVKDYYTISKRYGNKKDLKELLDKAHTLGIRVILDLVINHVSSTHPWFKEALDPKSSKRDYFYWLTPHEIKQKGIGKRRATDDSGVEYPWHSPYYKSPGKYYGMFWKEMPDLNLNSGKLKEELIAIASYWLEFGVDGFRLDAAKHIFPFWEPQEKTFAFWEHFKEALIKVKSDLLLIGEVWDSPEVVAPYFSSLQGNFNIDLSYDLKEILKFERDSVGLIEKLIATHQKYVQVNKRFVDCTLLSNHDQERIGSTLDGDIEKLKAAANLLFTMPGLPFIYYGEEWGMLGKKPDEYIREPMPWDTASETHWLRSKYNKDREAIKSKRDILESHYQKLIRFRKTYPGLSTPEGSNLQRANIEDDKLIAFIRKGEGHTFLILQNISNEVRLVGLPDGYRNVIFRDGEINISRERVRLGRFSFVVFVKAR
ncbi:alpha-amylase family glycosyl hydrolase [Jiulongibacter sp. NS-SX5]|uniref:alpha-amylase family glycosyl hydrolase n=1 Tax=Jiulongibacter sp. NS-SX5 TaxID=3463854 RepID=UPI004058DDED